MLNEPSPEMLKGIPPLYASPETPLEEVIIHGHFFGGAADWFAAEFDGEDIFFGYVNLGDPQCAEWGTFRLSELRDVRIPVEIHVGRETRRAAIGVEWDEHWRPRPFREIGR